MITDAARPRFPAETQIGTAASADVAIVQTTIHGATMNHLAHLLLAGPHPDHRLGALLGDHLKGRLVLEPLRPELRRGILLHRRIDHWSDHHPAVVDLRRRFQGSWRRYGGIMLDVLFDHMLDRHWERFGDRPLACFAEEIDALLQAHVDEFPPRLARFSQWALAMNLWRSFGDRHMLNRIFLGIARRHGRESPLIAGLELLDRHEAAIEATFLELFPDLMHSARNWRRIGRDYSS
ncbi:MAG: ACP phosphodiesterase [Wenzhouxiangellaceae bacterium]